MSPAPDQFDQLLVALMDREFEESPTMAAALGRDGFDHRLDDLSAEGFERRSGDDREWLRRFRQVDPEALTDDQRIDRALVESQLQLRVDLAGWEEWRRSPEGYLDTGITELFLMALRPEDELTESAVARLHAIGPVLANAERNLDPGRANRLIIDRSLAQCVASIGFARDEVAQLAGDPANRDRLQTAGEVAALAYEKFAGFLGDFGSKCTGSYEFGEERYNQVLATGELLDTDTVALRQLGWDEYDRVAEEMAGLASAIGGSKDWPTLIRGLQGRHPGSVDDMRAEYEVVTLDARRFMVEHGLVTDPPDEHCVVMPAPTAIRATLAVACYIAPPMFKPSREGHFFVPYPVDEHDAEEVNGLLESNAPYSMATTAVHEAYPGHHWHLMTMKEARPVRRIFMSTYFIEGWALYTEAMMRAAGFFTPEQELGQLEARLFRAARIVVDTSLHTGEMGFDQAVAFMHDKALLPLPTARSEVARYCAWPTQASAYLTGAMAIERARDDWLAAGGDLRRFHDLLAGSGAMPVPLAVRSIGSPGSA